MDGVIFAHYRYGLERAYLNVRSKMDGGITTRLAKNVKLLLDADVVSLQNGSGTNPFQAANRSVFLHAEIKY